MKWVMQVRLRTGLGVPFAVSQTVLAEKAEAIQVGSDACDRACNLDVGIAPRGLHQSSVRGKPPVYAAHNMGQQLFPTEVAEGCRTERLEG